MACSLRYDVQQDSKDFAKGGKHAPSEASLPRDDHLRWQYRLRCSPNHWDWQDSPRRSI